MPPRSLPLPPRGGGALRPILVVRFILRFLEAVQCRQRFLEVRSMPYWHRIGTDKVRTDPPVATVYQFLLVWQYGCGLRSQAPVPMTVWPAFPDVKVRDRKEVYHGFDILLVFCCVIFQEVPARAEDDANVPIRQACSALCFWLHIDYLA